MSVNNQILEQKLVELERSRTWSPRVVSKLESLVGTGEEHELFRINPISFGSTRSVPVNEAIDLFIHAAKLGIFTMNWELICPTCSTAVESYAGLANLHSHFFCNMCSRDFQVDLDDFIMVSFTIHPQVRPIRYHNPASLSYDDYLRRYNFCREGKFGGKLDFAEFLDMMGNAGGYIEPGAELIVNLNPSSGMLKGFDLGNNYGIMVPVEGAPSEEEQVLNVVVQKNGTYTERTSVRPGRVKLVVLNQGPQRSTFFLGVIPPMEGGSSAMEMKFDPFLTGKKVLSTQSFRNLYRNETFSGEEGIGVRELSFVFTDLKGSTALYDRVGDLKAFTLVRQHFDSLGKVVNAYNGAVVKTMGDAIMATFMSPGEALKASIDMMHEIEQFNRTQGAKDLILKIGVHCGPCLAVSMNDHVDYFGQTVNIAARVQALADGDEIFLTKNIFDRDDVQMVLSTLDVQQSVARLKGVQEELPVYKINHRPRAA